MKREKIIFKLLLFGMCVSLCTGITSMNPVNTFANSNEIQWSQDDKVTIDGIVFSKTSDTTVTLTNITDDVIDLVIPSTVTVDGKEYKVNTIGERACEHKDNLKSIYIPKTITKIDKWTMGFNKNLTKVEFDEDSPITTLPDGTFALNQNLKEITLPKGLKRIKSFAFNSCQSLRRLKLPDEVEIIDSFAFVCMVKGSQLNPDYLDPNIGVDRFDLIIPGTVECVGSNAFSLSKNKIYITIVGEGEVTPGGTTLSDLKGLICSGGGIENTTNTDDGDVTAGAEPKIKIIYSKDSKLTEDEKVY